MSGVLGMMRSCAAAALLSLLLVFAGGVPASATQYSDPRIGAWSQMTLEGDLPGAFEAVSADLLSPDPHPFAAYVWTQLAIGLGRVDADGAPVAEGALGAALGDRPLAFVSYARARPARALALYPDIEAIEDPWLLWTIAHSANDLALPATAARAVVAYLQRFPEEFEGVWLADTIGRNDLARAMILEALEGPDVSSPPGWRMAREALSPRFTGAADEYQLVQRWLKDAPEDARALRFLGHQHRLAKRWEAGVRAYETATRVFPFYANGQQQALIHAHAQDFDAAREAVEAMAAVARPAGPVRQAYAAASLGGALMGAGEYGRARAVLADGLQAKPDDPEILYQQALLEQKAWGAAGAVERAEAASAALIALTPDDPRAVQTRIRVLQRSGDAAGVLALWESHTAAGGATNASMLWAVWNAHHARKRHDEAAALAAPLAAAHPGAAWMQGNIAYSLLNSGRRAEARDYLLQSAGLFAPTAYRLARLKDAYKELGQEPAYAETLAELARRWPYKEPVINAFRQTLSGPALQRLDQRIAADTDLAVIMALGEGDRLVRSKRPADLNRGVAILSEALQRNGLSVGQRAELRYLRGRLGARLEQRTLGRAGAIDAALADLAAAEAVGAGSYKTIAEARYQGLLAAKRLDDAADALLALEAVRSGLVAISVFRDAAIRRRGKDRPRPGVHRAGTMGGAAADGHGAPGNPCQVSSALGGGPLNSIRIVERMRTIDPDYDVDWMIKEAYGRLGMHKEHFLALGANKRRVAASERYVRWWAGDRRDAQKPGAAVSGSTSTP